MSKSNLIKVLVIAALAGGALFFALRQRRPKPVAIGDAAPSFSLPGLDSGPIALRDYHRKVVILNFWATWCPPCVEETPSLVKFAEEMRGKNVQVIGVSVDQNRNAVDKFAEDFHVPYPIALDPDQTVSSRYGTFKFPETYILDRNGRVADKIIGAANWDDPRMRTFVEGLAGSSTHQGK